MPREPSVIHRGNRYEIGKKVLASALANMLTMQPIIKKTTFAFKKGEGVDIGHNYENWNNDSGLSVAKRVIAG